MYGCATVKSTATVTKRRPDMDKGIESVIAKAVGDAERIPS